MPQNDIMQTYKSQQFKRENTVENDLNTVEFRSSDPEDLTANPRRMWANIVDESLKYTVDGVNITQVASKADVDTLQADYGTQRGRTPFSGGDLVYTDDGTNKIVTNSYSDNDKIVFGREYLSAIHKKIMDGTNIKLVTSGDSTTAGDGTTAPYHIDTLIKMMFDRDSFASVMTATNRGQSGQATFQWASTHVTGDIAANPDLLILRWGVNDPGWNKDGTPATAGTAGDATRRNINDFRTSLRAGLTTLRASKPLATTSVILMTPNSTYDTPNRRDSLWYEQVTNVVRQAARDFQCCFIDTYAFLQDSVNGADYMDSPYADQRHIHPADVMNMWISGLIYDTAFPIGLRMKHSNGLNNPSSSTILKTNADTPSTYPKGVSMYRGFSGFPYDGMVITFHQTDDILLQINNGYETTKSEFAFRIGYRATNIWSAWATVGGSSGGVGLPASIAPTLLNGWVNYDVATQTPAGYYIDANGIVHLEGLIKSGTATSGTDLFVLPVGYRPSKGRGFPATSAAAYGSVFVDGAGNVKIIAGSSSDFSLDGITFPAR